MTPTQPEEEARRDECVAIVEGWAETIRKSEGIDLRPTPEDRERILAAAKPPEPKRWPLEIARHEDFTAQVVEVGDGDRRFLAIVAVQDDGSGHIGPLTMSHAHRDRLVVALLEERGIDPERLQHHASYTGTGGSTPACGDARTLGRLIANAKGGDARD